MPISRTCLLTAALLAAPLAPASALLQDAGSTAAPPCATPEHRHFDFWIGEWEVRTPDGQLAGTNRIEPILDGCALRESWTGAGGGSGTSLNAWDPARGVWHQTWVGKSGPMLYLDGKLEEGRMVLGGTSPGAEAGATVRHRITWEPLEGGRVRQHWQTSEDGGETWQTVFDGTYSPRGGGSAS